MRNVWLIQAQICKSLFQEMESVIGVYVDSDCTSELGTVGDLG